MAYASKYYDPVKAHEYYMKHRKLKGRKKRTSTAGLNEKGKIAAKEVKEQLMAEKKEFLAQIREIMNNQIKALREQLKGMSKEEKAQMKEQIEEQIKALREQNKAHREKVKEYYDEKYAQELDKIRQDGSMVGGSSRKRSKKRR